MSLWSDIDVIASNIIGVIPKASSAERVKENSEIFDFHLTEEDMETLSGLDTSHHFCWDPTDVA